MRNIVRRDWPRLVALGLAIAGFAFAGAAASRMAGAASRTDASGVPAMPRAKALRSPAGPGAGESRLATTGDGSLLLSWLEPQKPAGRGAAPGSADKNAPKPYALRLASLTGSKWSATLNVVEGDSFFVNWADFPAVSAFGEHGLAVAWLWKSGEATYAYQARLALSSDGGATWTAPIVLHEDREGTEHGFLSLLPQGVGVRAVWLDGHNFKGDLEEGMADMTLHSRFVSPTGTLGHEQELDGRTCDCCQTAAVAVGGDILVAYRDRSPEEIRDISVSRLEGGRWSAPQSVHEDGWVMPGCPVNGPALASRDRQVVIAWYTAANDSPRVKVAFSKDGGRTFGDPIRIDEGNALGRVGVAMLEDGTAAVSWMEGDAREAQLRARFVRDGVGAGASMTVGRMSGARASGVPQLVRDRDRLVFAWTEPGKVAQVRVAEIRLPKR